MQALRRPFVSIVIPNYNNAPYLEKCVTSVLSQTLPNIEIIIIDDYSTDDSHVILKKYDAVNQQMKIIFFSENKSQHMAKKAGVEAATGQYIMFLDSDDFLEPDACAGAYAAAEATGVEIVFFNTNIRHGQSIPESKIARMHEILNGLPAGIYDARQIMKLQLHEHKFMHNLCNKLFSANLCKMAFSAMSDCYLIGGEDFYEFMFILSYNPKLAKINANLYNYNYGVGIATSNNKCKNTLAYYDYGRMLPSLKEHLEINNLEEWISDIKHCLFMWDMGNMINISAENFPKYLNRLVQYYGESFTIEHIIETHFDKWQQIALKSSFIKKKVNKSHNSIAIYFSRSRLDFMWIFMLCEELIRKHGKRITLIFDADTSIDELFKHTCIQRYNVQILPSSASNADRCVALSDILHANCCSLFLYVSFWSKFMLWDIITAHLASSTVAINLHNGNMADIVAYTKKYRLMDIINVFRNADINITESLNEALFMKAFCPDVRMPSRESLKVNNDPACFGLHIWEERYRNLIKTFGKNDFDTVNTEEYINEMLSRAASFAKTLDVDLVNTLNCDATNSEYEELTRNLSNLLENHSR